MSNEGLMKEFLSLFSQKMLSERVVTQQNNIGGW